MQADVECEYGYERHNEECRPIYGLESAKCSIIDHDNYVVSETKHRLIEGDTCSGLAHIISDTDGKGNLPGGHHGRHPSHARTGTTVFLVMLVRSWHTRDLCLRHVSAVLELQHSAENALV
jgi:hypothetical protein